MAQSAIPNSTAASIAEGHGGLLATLAMKEHGIEVLFTLSGAHVFPVYDGCLKHDIRIVDVRHEQTAVFAAEAWAKVTRRPGVAALTAGPGVTNGVSAITSCHFTGSPVLVIGGRAPEARWGQGSLQEMDHVPIVASITRFAETCRTTAGIGEAVHAALMAARSPHRGPAFVDLPFDVIFGSAQGTIPPPPTAAELRGPEADPDDVQAVGRLLARAERPVLLAGADVYWGDADASLRALAEEARVPVFMNGLGRGTLAADHELAFSRSRSRAFKSADLVIVVGTPLDFRLGYGKFGSAQVVHLMDTPEHIAGHVELAGSAAGALGSLLAGVRAAALAGGKKDRGDWVATLRGDETAKREAEKELLAAASTPIHPARIYGELLARLDRDAIVIGDGGDFVSYAGKYVDTFTPGCFLDPGPFGCLGTGPGYALGAGLAHPDRQLVLLLGDGAAGFSLGDFDTLARFEIPVVAIVGNNACWGLEKHPMKQLYGYHVAAELDPETSYSGAAQALGAAGERITDPEEIGPALDRAFAAKGPVLLEVMTDPENVYPRSSSLA